MEDKVEEFNKRASVWVALFDNLKKIALGTATILIVVLVVGSGNGIKMMSSFYESISGNKIERFRPLIDIQHTSYLVLEDSLKREGITTSPRTVDVYKTSETSFKYRVKTNGQKVLYSVIQDAQGVWQINRLE